MLSHTVTVRASPCLPIAPMLRINLNHQVSPMVPYCSTKACSAKSMARPSAAALLTVSSNSASGTESATRPAPACSTHTHTRLASVFYFIGQSACCFTEGLHIKHAAAHIHSKQGHVASMLQSQGRLTLQDSAQKGRGQCKLLEQQV